MARIRINTPELINNLMMDHDVILDATKVLYSIINNSNLNLEDHDIYLYNLTIINYDYVLFNKIHKFKFISELQYHYDLCSFNCSTRLSVNSTSAFITCTYGLLVDILLFIMMDAL